MRAGHDDYDRLAWEPSPDPFAAVLAVALRCGAPTQTGLVVSTSSASKVLFALALRRMYEDMATRRAAPHMKVAHAAMAATLGSGLANLNRRAQTAQDEAATADMEAADAEAMKVLELPLNAALVAHWTNLGGTIPMDMQTE
ncbi:hypothetical protein [Micrococcus luteus]